MSSPDDLVTATKNEVIAINNIGRVLTDFASRSPVLGQNVFDPYNLSVYNGVPDCTLALQAVLDNCFGTSGSPHGSTATSNTEFVLPHGTFNITAPLHVTNVRGGILRGAGRFATNVVNTAGGNVFVTNGFEYSRVSGMRLNGTGAVGTLFDLDWGNTGGTALQSNTFSDMYFEGSGIGVRIGNTGFMGSENLFLNCFFSSNAIAGLKTNNYNALQNTVVGGNFQNCGKGIWVSQGSVPGILSVGFQNGNTAYDIVVDNSANDAYCIDGCRTESANFASLNNGPIVTISGCSQINATAGDFAAGSANMLIHGCYSQNGRVSTNAIHRINVEVCTFDRADWQQGSSNYVIDSVAHVRGIGDPFTLNQHFISNSLLVGDGGGAPWTLTIPSEADFLAATGLIIPIGVHINVVQYNAMQITVAAGTGVTLHTARSLTTRAQYSVISLDKVDVNKWVVSGDLT